LRIVSVAVPAVTAGGARMIVAFTAADSVSETVSSFSMTSLSRMGMLKPWLVTPGAKVSVPLVVV
jgi:hypothetical protein